MRVHPQHKKKLSVYGHILIYKCHKLLWAFPFLHKGPSWQPVLSLKYRMSTGAAGACMHVERENINRICSAKISIVLNYLLLKVNLRFKSQHAMRVFYESRNFKGITACNCLNINMRRSITAFFWIKKWLWDMTVIKVNLCIPHLLSLLSLLFTFLKEILTIFTIYNSQQIYVRFLTNYVRFVPLLL